MTKVRRLGFWILLALSVLGGLAIAVSMGFALAALSDGPSANGYSLLLTAMALLPYLAVAIVLTVIIGSIGTRLRFAIGGLALASGVVAGIAAGLVALGSTLDRIDPLRQPPALNSMILAMRGVGEQLIPDALILSIGVVVLATGAVIARRGMTRSSSPSIGTAAAT
jgi:hypothetical protein